MKRKIGLMGFGKTGKAVAAVILQNQEFSLEWVLRRTTILENRSVPEFLGLESEEPGLIYSTEHIGIDELLDKHPVDLM
jgi:4-hydroxy-tetrahydrodipicolinate reductase